MKTIQHIKKPIILFVFGLCLTVLTAHTLGETPVGKTNSQKEKSFLQKKSMRPLSEKPKSAQPLTREQIMHQQKQAAGKNPGTAETEKAIKEYLTKQSN